MSGFYILTGFGFLIIFEFIFNLTSNNVSCIRISDFRGPWRRCGGGSDTLMGLF